MKVKNKNRIIENSLFIKHFDTEKHKKLFESGEILLRTYSYYRSADG